MFRRLVTAVLIVATLATVAAFTVRYDETSGRVHTPVVDIPDPFNDAVTVAHNEAASVRSDPVRNDPGPDRHVHRTHGLTLDHHEDGSVVASSPRRRVVIDKDAETKRWDVKRYGAWKRVPERVNGGRWHRQGCLWHVGDTTTVICPNGKFYRS